MTELSNLIVTLMHQYQILPSTDPLNSVQPHKNTHNNPHYNSTDLGLRCRQLEKQNSLLKTQLYELNTERRKQKDNLELEMLREKVGIFQKTFKEEQKFVNQLKGMLCEKETQVKDLVQEYQAKIGILGRKLEKYASNEYVLSLTQEIQDLNLLLKKQEGIMLEMLDRNRILEEQLSEKGSRMLQNKELRNNRINESYGQDHE